MMQLRTCTSTAIAPAAAAAADADAAQIKAANKAFLKHIANVNRSEDLLLQAGWRPKVRWALQKQACDRLVMTQIT
jgi:hypothetical protein